MGGLQGRGVGEDEDGFFFFFFFLGCRLGSGGGKTGGEERKGREGEGRVGEDGCGFFFFFLRVNYYFIKLF